MRAALNAFLYNTGALPPVLTMPLPSRSELLASFYTLQSSPILTFISLSGTESKNFMLVLATNQPQLLDRAVRGEI